MARLNCCLAGSRTLRDAGKSHTVFLGLAVKGLSSKIYLISPISWSEQKSLGARGEQVNIKKEIPKGPKAKWAKLHSGDLSD